jgi:pyruvate formate lyase activating enzyme
LRLIIFLQGCPVHCLFCHNPETISFSDKSKKITVDEVIELYRRNETFYQNGGGITLSGGESMAQINFVIALFKKCRELGIHTALDTAAGPMALLTTKQLSDVVKYADLFIIDIKHPDNEMAIKLTSTGNVNQIGLIKLLEQKQVHF